jgi:hypothetical protein
METWLVPGAHLELAPVFLGAALLLAAGLLRAARRRRSRGVRPVPGRVDPSVALSAVLPVLLAAEQPGDLPTD